uniref:PAM2 domain-containing protein n=2 Tax=Macrostomum lignano TaxID=282301 RepID=A0A1I8JKZ6_9PLAT
MEQLHAASDGPGVAAASARPQLLTQPAQSRALSSVLEETPPMVSSSSSAAAAAVVSSSPAAAVVSSSPAAASAGASGYQQGRPANGGDFFGAAPPAAAPAIKSYNPFLATSPEAQQPAPWPSTSAAAVAPAAAASSASAALSNAAWRQFDQADPFDVTWADRAARAHQPSCTNPFLPQQQPQGGSGKAFRVDM